ncbi:hypothetical protein J7J00_18740 [Bacillus sp. ISL-4]|uniref:hypothetical protein n=1 Tax=Bacillus sp. ISL-4 TaxID=2819125 RepID=UPI001BEBFA65|nr:hypothetical protein [Bacillus sp. ISL-4]MBT2667494.1 hypothetical protein [Bacillus sp. ISL-4]MBT2672967.1 hypothetical protein [Streptomyces sp. ISL-14]
MIRFDDYPKSIKKAIRYIKQDAPLAQLNNLETILLKSIKKRKELIQGNKD